MCENFSSIYTLKICCYIFIIIFYRKESFVFSYIKWNKCLADGFYDIIIYSNKSQHKTTSANQNFTRFFLFKKKNHQNSALKKNHTKCDLSIFPTFFDFFFVFCFSFEHYQNHNLLPLNKTPNENVSFFMKEYICHIVFLMWT